MNRQGLALPVSVALTGADYLLLAFDRAMQRGTQHGNVCHLLLQLDSPLSADDLRDHLDDHPFVAWLASLRFTPLQWWKPARWVVDNDAPPLRIDEHRLDSIEELPSRFIHNLDVEREPLVSFMLVHVGDRSAIVLRWHHALLDGRGAELLITALSTGLVDRETVTGTEMVPTTPLTERMWEAKAARDFVWKQSTGSVAFYAPPRAPKGAQIRVRRLVLDEAQTEEADRRSGHALMRSAWNLAISAAAVSAARPDAKGDYLLVPVPQDRRTRGARGPILANQLNLLFYRIRRDSLGDIGQAVKALTEQTRSIMRARLHQTYPVLLDLCRYVPLGVLNTIIRVPTWGRMATFGFSDVGDSLSELETLAGRRLVDIVHYPANMHPPGITVVFSRFRGRLSICVATLDGTISESETDIVMAKLRESLGLDA